MDYQKLLEPYAENDRTLEGQMVWLQKKGFSQIIIETAVRAIYGRLEEGEKFENGHALDRELFSVATELSKEEAKLLVKNLDRYVDGGRFKKAWNALRGKW
jgi:hypothetical protein